jgi:hypothetical protein
MAGRTTFGGWIVETEHTGGTVARPLSVCCLTSDRPAMVAAVLGLLRDVADDIVVAVDARVDPTTLGPLLAVADRVTRFEYADPPERARPWLLSLCRNDAIFSIDGDEVPSGALVSALPELAADDAVAQCRIARRWCFPDERSWLGERPWWPDFQRRLVRRGPLLDHHVSVHGGVRAAWPARNVVEPIYHLVCMLRGFADRRRRAREYDEQRPGMVAVGGGPMNDTLYVPEHFAVTRPRPTPAEDAAAIRHVLDAPDPGRGVVAAIPVVAGAEIAAHLPVDGLEPDGYAARLRVVEPDLRTDPGNDTLLAVEITNAGSVPFPREDRPGIQLRIGTRVIDRRPGSPRASWTLTELPCDVPPGTSRVVEALVHVPGSPGTYTVEVDLVNERGRWFGCVTSFDLAVTTRWGRFSP